MTQYSPAATSLEPAEQFLETDLKFAGSLPIIDWGGHALARQHGSMEGARDGQDHPDQGGPVRHGEYAQRRPGRRPPRCRTRDGSAVFQLLANVRSGAAKVPLLGRAGCPGPPTALGDGHRIPRLRWPVVQTVHSLPGFDRNPDRAVHSVLELPAGTLGRLETRTGDVLTMYRSEAG